MPVSSLGYVLSLLTKSVFIVVETRIDAGSSEMMLENPVSITSLDTRFDTDKRNLIITKRVS